MLFFEDAVIIVSNFLETFQNFFVAKNR